MPLDKWRRVLGRSVSGLGFPFFGRAPRFSRGGAGVNVLNGPAVEAVAVVRFEPVECGVRLRIQSEPGAVLDEK